MSTQFIGANHFIPLAKGKKLKKFFKEKKGQLTNPGISKKDILPDSETFDRAAIDRLLALPGCVGIRIYLGLDEEFKVRLILVGVDEQGHDLIIPSTSSASFSTATSATFSTTTSPTEEEGEVVEEGLRCPPICPPPGGLESQ